MTNILSSSAGSNALYFLWWAIAVILFGYLVGRFISLSQRFIIKMYSLSSANQPRWSITVVHAVTWTIHVLLWVIIAVIIGTKAGLPSAFVAGVGTLLGAGIGFGSQEVFRDILKGTVHLTEKLFAVGDFVTFTVAGEKYSGTVERVSLRHVSIRTMTTLTHIPQGLVAVAENHTAGIGNFLISVPFPMDSPIEDIMEMLTDIVDGINDHDGAVKEYVPSAYHEALDAIKSLELWGISDVSNGYIKVNVYGETWPGENHFAAKRGVLTAIVYKMKSSGIQLARTVAINGGE